MTGSVCWDVASMQHGAVVAMAYHIGLNTVHRFLPQAHGLRVFDTL
jgi:hypothetical protein